MSSFKDRFGGLTEKQAQELKEAAEWFCNHDVVCNEEEK